MAISAADGYYPRRTLILGHAMNLKLRYAAALASVGWFLLGPPQQGGNADFDLHAPLKKWAIIDNYEDVAACERGRMVHLSEWYDRADRDRPGSKNAIKDAIMLIWLGDAQCVASDDPHLK
jgi:hypothetical protein